VLRDLVDEVQDVDLIDPDPVTHKWHPRSRLEELCEATDGGPRRHWDSVGPHRCPL
jgi:hypothetical protein